MPRNFTNTLKANLIRTSVNESPIVLIEISNPLLTNPIRLVRDNKDVVSNSLTYTACMFDIELPSEQEKEIKNINENNAKIFFMLSPNSVIIH